MLLHCFGGCETSDVLAAIGLSFSDLFDKPLDHQEQIRERRGRLESVQVLRQAPVTDFLKPKNRLMILNTCSTLARTLDLRRFVALSPPVALVSEVLIWGAPARIASCCLSRPRPGGPT